MPPPRPITRAYRYQQRLRAQGKCPGCQDPTGRYIYCLACRLERRVRTNAYNAKKRAVKQRALAQLQIRKGEAA